MKVAQRRGRGPEMDIQRERGHCIYRAMRTRSPYCVYLRLGSPCIARTDVVCIRWFLVSLPGCVVGIVSGSGPAQTEPGPAQRVAGI